MVDLDLVLAQTRDPWQELLSQRVIIAGGTGFFGCWQMEWAPFPGDTGAEGAPKPQTYPVKLTVLCDDRAGLLKEFTAIISDEGTNIRSSSSEATNDDGGAW